ncbi:MAG TPA: hypothetical protein VF507_02720 [Pyrinomonadaceae bacterium]|jgi:hypothetical protein
MTETPTLYLTLGGGDEAPPRPRDGYWLDRELLHAECFPAGMSAAGRAPASREDAPQTCDACGALVRYATDYLEVRRDRFGTLYTMLPDTTPGGWRKAATGWAAWLADVEAEETEPCPVSDLPDDLRREIAELYGGLREYIPAPLLHYNPIFTRQRVKLVCPECGGNGRRDQSNPRLGDNHCETCGGSGRVPCPCEECDERAAGKR